VDSTPPRPPHRRPGIPLGRLLGVPLHLNWSWVLLAVLVTLLYGQSVRVRLELSEAGGYVVGLGFALCLLLSVLLHELGHALTARRAGIGVRGITLELLGGYTEMDRDAPNPRIELLVSLAGPAVSLALGLAAGLAWFALPAGTVPNEVAYIVAVSNLLVAVFNSLPGLPLDGGRALRAAVWAVSGSQLRGTLVAARCGQVVAVATAAGAALLYMVQFISLFGLVFLLLVALTLWQGAGASVKVALASVRVPLIDVDRLARPIFAVPSGTPLAEAQRRAAESGPPGAALMIADTTGRLTALVHQAAADAVPVSRRPWVTVDTVARSVDGLRSMPAGLRGTDVLTVLQADPGGEYLVTTDERVVGVLRAADVARVLRSGPTGPSGPAGPVGGAP